MPSPILKNSAGFTLIEVMVVTVLFVLIIAGLFELYMWHGKMYDYEQALARTEGSARAAVDNMDAYISQAYRVLPSATINGNLYATATTTLVAELPAIDGSGDVLNGKWDTVAFYLTGNQLFEAVSSDPSSSRLSLVKQLSDTAESLAFTYNNTDDSQVTEVTVSLTTTTQMQTTKQTVSSAVEQDIYLRNY